MWSLQIIAKKFRFPNVHLLGVALALASLFIAAAAVAQPFILSGDDWARPRSGQTVAEMPTIRAVVQQWSKTQTDAIAISYPGGESGSLWASELRDWLVALGIPSGSIVIQPGSPNGDEVVMEVVAR